MTTFLTAHNWSGHVGRCNAKCYNATKQKCTCICGGRNHGVGPQGAYENTTKITESEIKENYQVKTGIGNLRIFKKQHQKELFK